MQLRVEEILRLHREYLAGPPPDEPSELAEPERRSSLARVAEAFDPGPDRAAGLSR